MATTTTNTLKITFSSMDSRGVEYSYMVKLENPRENLSLSDVNTAFTGQFSSDTALIVSAKTGNVILPITDAYYEVISQTSLT